MRVVITHSNADCDAFASQIAVQVLNPDVSVLVSRRVAPRVHQFLTLHRDAFTLTTLDEIDASAVTEIIVVDVRDRGRLREHKTLLDRLDDDSNEIRVEVWDHHDPGIDELPADTQHIETVGATTTMLVEEMRAREVTLSPIHATLFSLAIHVDTGSLTYDTSTSRDLSALGWLMEQGAKLDVVEQYLRLPLTDGQREVFLRLMDSIEVEEFGGIEIGIGGVSLDDGVDGLSFVTTQALRLNGCAALFAAFHIRGRKLQLVGRARHDAVHVGEALRVLGGGGHAAAGAATVKTQDPMQSLDRLRAHLRATVGRGAGIESWIDEVVPSVRGSLTIDDADSLMQARGYRYVFVTGDAGTYVGAFDASLAQSALAAGRGGLPVKSSMHHSVPSISRNVAMSAALKRFQDTDAGLLLVVDEDEAPVGALLRERCMRALYEVD